MAFDPQEVRELFQELTGSDNVWDASVVEKVRHEEPVEEDPEAVMAEGMA